MSTAPPAKYIMYCRKSSESEDKQVMSLDAQERELWNLARHHDLEVVEVMKESMSAKAPGRPVFSRMLEKISNGEANGIICWKLDRLARNPIDGGSISWMLQQNDIKAIRTHDSQFLPTDNVIMMSLEFGMSNEYIRQLSANVKRGNRQKLEKGEWPNHAPYGYKNDKVTKTLVVDEKEARNVQEMFRLYATGRYSLKQIANELGVYKNLVERVLKKTFYYGLMERDGKFYPGIHEPIINKTLFDEVARVREETARPRPKTLFFPFRGLMTCAECGCQLTASRKKQKYDYYYCTNGKGNCSQHKKYMREAEVNSLFFDAINRLKIDDELIEIMYEAACERLKNSSQDSERVLADLDLELQQITRKERRLYDSYESELVSDTHYREKATQLKEQRKAAQMKKLNFTKNVESQVGALEPTKRFFKDVNTRVFNYLSSSEEEKRKLAEIVLWNLEVKDKNVAQYKYRSPYQALAELPE